MDDSGTKGALLATLRAEREGWDGLLAEVGDGRLMEPGVAGDWSVKDVLGHLTAYQQAWVARLRHAATGVPPTTLELFGVEALPEGAAEWSEEEQNAAIREHYAPLSSEEVLARWREAANGLEAGVAALAAEDLVTPGRFQWAGERPLAEAMAADTHDHAAEHAAGVRSWLDRSGD